MDIPSFRIFKKVHTSEDCSLNLLCVNCNTVSKFYTFRDLSDYGKLNKTHHFALYLSNLIYRHIATSSYTDTTKIKKQFCSVKCLYDFINKNKPLLVYLSIKYPNS